MKINLTYTCDSPLITFSGNWTAESNSVQASSNAPAVRMVSRAHGDSLTFNFTGTGIWIYPATNTPRSSFDVYLDGTLSRFDGSNEPSDVTDPLFSKTGLLFIPHVVSIHNTGALSLGSSPYLDLAYVTYEYRDKFGNATSMDVSGDYADSRNIAWYPPEEWTTSTRVVLLGSQNVTFKYRKTAAADAWMEYNFTGSTLSVFGSVGPSYGAYSVSLRYADGEDITDDDDPGNALPITRESELYERTVYHAFNGSFSIDRQGVLLYRATNLNSGRVMTLVMRNLPQKQGQLLAVERTELFKYGYQLPKPRARGLSGGGIAGLVVGSLLLVGICFLALYFLRQRRRGQLVRQQKTNLFRDILARRGILSNPDAKRTSHTTIHGNNDFSLDPNTTLSPLDVHGARPL